MEPYNQPRSAFWGRGTIAAGVLLLILLLLAAYVLYVRNGTSHNATPTPSPAATTPPSSTKPGSTTTTTRRPATSTSCDLPDTGQSVPEATPLGITWNLYQTVALPSSRAAGPEIIDGDVARCYAHTPTGALVAASQLSARYLIAPDWRAVVREQVVPSVGRSTYTAERAKVGNEGGNQPGDYDQYSGFKYVTYSPAVAVIEFVTRSDSGSMQATTSTVDWLDGDWKLQLQPNGSDSPTALPVTSLVGYSTWSGV